MALNPPPHDVRRAAALPFIGWITTALGIYIAIKVLYTTDTADTGKPVAWGPPLDCVLAAPVLRKNPVLGDELVECSFTP
jgi:hypothetical protein